MGADGPWLAAGFICGLIFGLLFLATLAKPAPPLKIKNWATHAWSLAHWASHFRRGTCKARCDGVSCAT